MNKHYYAGQTRGRMEERESILIMLEVYFDLTQEPDETGKVTENPEWDNGFQAAISLIRNTRMKHDGNCFMSEGKWDAGCTCKSVQPRARKTYSNWRKKSKVRKKQ